MDHVAVLLVELGLLFLGLSVLGALARRFGLTPIPFVLVAALAFGEGGTASLETSEPFLTAAAEIGVVLLLLTLGLEFSADELFGSLRRHAPSGVVDLLLNFPPGLVAGLLLGFPWQAALALGGITWISSSGIVAQLLGDLGRLANRETPSILSVLVLEDLAMALFLPLLVVALTDDGADVDLHVLAVPGAVSADLPRQVRAAGPLDADLALVVIGANDLVRLVPPERAAASLDEALRGLRAAGTDVVLVPAPDMSSVPFVPPAFRPLVQAASAQLRHRQATVATATGVTVAAVADVNQVFGTDPTMFAADRFHPSSAGYARIAAALTPTVLAVARARRDAAVA